jgi:hypothetical protein
MPIHDWTTIFDGAFHDFHLEWISTIKHVLNRQVLPAGYYAAAEQVAGDVVADVLALDSSRAEGSPDRSGQAETGGVALLTSPPDVQFRYAADPDFPSVPRSRVVVRHRSRNAVVAVIEIVSPGNKSSQRAIDAFVYKAIDLLQAGIHLLVIDVIPPGPRDPNGIHGAIWRDLWDQDFPLPPERPLTLAAYAAGSPVQGFVDPAAVGEPLPDASLFLTTDSRVLIPLEQTYLEAFERVPSEWQKLLNSGLRRGR